MPRVRDSRMAIPLTALFLASDHEIEAMMLLFADGLVRALTKGVPNGEPPSVQNFGNALRYAEVGLQELFGKNAADVDAMYSKPGTYPNIVARGIRTGAAVAVDPMIERARREIEDFEKRFTQRTLVRDLAIPSPIVNSRNWADPNGDRLSSRVWKAGDESLRQIDAILRYEIRQGTSANKIAASLEKFLTNEGAKSRTNKPGGTEGSYAARRLARTEISRAHGNGVTFAAHIDPFTVGVRWNLGFTHPKLDECDGNSIANSFGLGSGVYPPLNVPLYPNHPHCKCYLTPVDAQNRDRVRFEIANELLDISGLDADTIIEQVSGFTAAK